MLTKKQGSPYLYWLGLALVFFGLAVDEFASIHEEFNNPVWRLFKTSGYLGFEWVIPYGVATIILAIIYLRFFLNLPKQTLKLFLISGGIFLSGAIGLEMLAAKHWQLHETKNLGFQLLGTSEEFLVMTGVSIFIYALLLYMRATFGTCGISVSGNEISEGPH